MKKIILLLSFWLVGGWLYAQQFDDSCTSAFEDISASGTALNLSDDAEVHIQIPFSFTLGTVTSQDLVVGNNGGVLFGRTSGNLNSGNQELSSSNAYNGFYPFWDDIDDGRGNVYWEVKGTAPNRYLIVEWYQRPHYSNIGNATFELVLYEGTNEVEFRYLDLEFGDSRFDYGASATIGIKSDVGVYQYSYNTAIDSNVTCIHWRPPYSNPQFTYTIVPDCGNNRFNIEVNITDTGGADTLTVSDSYGHSLQATGTGTVVIGPYGNAGMIGIYVTNSDDTQYSSSAFIVYDCNDHCEGADTITVYPYGQLPAYPDDFMNGEATPSPYSATSCDPDSSNVDAFVTFAAPAGGRVKVHLNHEMSMAAYDHCGGNEIACFAPDSTHILNNLTPGQYYILQLWEGNQPSLDFSIALEELPPPPANDLCENAELLPVGSDCNMHTVTNEWATDSGVADPGCGGYNGGDVWYKVVVPQTGDLIVRTGSSGNASVDDTGLAAYTGDCGQLNLLDCNDNYGNNNGFSELVIKNQTPGDTLFIRVWENGNDVSGEFGICAMETDIPDNDDCDRPDTLTVYAHGMSAGHEIWGNTDRATPSPYAATSCDSDTTNLDLFYTFTAPPSGRLWILTGGAQGRYIKAAIKDSCGGNEIICYGSSKQKWVQGLTPGQTYILQVWTDPDSWRRGEFSLALEEPPAPPANDDCSSAEVLTVYPYGQAEGNETVINMWGATPSQYAQTSCNSYNPTLDVFYSFTAPSNGKVWVKLDGDISEGFISLYDNCGGNEISCNYINQKKLLTGLTPGQDYILQFSEPDFQIDNVNIVLEETPPAPANDGCSHAEELTVYDPYHYEGNGTVFNNAGASTSQYSSSCQNSNHTYLDVFYSFTAPDDGEVYIKTSSYSVGYNIYNSCGGSSVYCSRGNNVSHITGLTPGQHYILQVWTDETMAGEYWIVLIKNATNNTCNRPDTLTVYPFGGSAGHKTLGNTEYATSSSYASTPCSPNADNKDLFYTFTAPASGRLWILIGGRTRHYIKTAILDSCGSTPIECRNYGGKKWVQGLTPGHNYILQVWSENISWQSGKFYIALEEPPAAPENDDCSMAAHLEVYPPGMGAGNETDVSIWGATPSQYSQTSCNSFNPTLDIFYSFTAPASGKVKIITGDNNQWTVGGWYAVPTVYTSCGGAEIRCTPYADNVFLVDSLTPGRNYILQLANRDYSVTDYTVVLEEFDNIPSNSVCSQAVPLTVYPAGQGAGHETNGDLRNVFPDTTNIPSCSYYSSYGYDVFSMYYTFTAPDSGEVWLIQEGSVYMDQNIGYYGLTVRDTCNGQEIFCTSSLAWGTEGGVKHITGLTPGQTYLLQIWSHSWNRGTFSFVLEENPPVPANDDCANAEYLTVYPAGQGYNNRTPASLRMADTSSMNCWYGYYEEPDIFYSFTAPANGEVNLFVKDNYFIEFFASVLDNCNGSPIYCGEFVDGKITFSGLIPGNNYILRLFSIPQYWDTGGEFDIWLEETGNTPENDVCSGADTLTVYPYGQGAGHEITVNNSNYSMGSDRVSSCEYGSNHNTDIYFTFRAPDNGKVKIMIGGEMGSKVSGSIMESCSGNEVYCWSYFVNVYPKVISGLIPGQYYILKLWNYTLWLGNYTVLLEELPPAPANDSCASADTLVIYSSYNPTTADNTGATDSGIADPGCGNYKGGDVWYYLPVATDLDTLYIKASVMAGSDFNNPAMAVYTGDCSNPTLVACADDVDTQNGELDAEIMLTGVTANTVYYVRVWDYGNNNFGEFHVGAYSPNVSVEGVVFSGFSVYPNPAGDRIYWTAGKPVDRVRVYDLTGQLIMETEHPDQNYLDIQGLVPGVYLLRVDMDGKQGGFRFIKK